MDILIILLISFIIGITIYKRKRSQGASKEEAQKRMVVVGLMVSFFLYIGYWLIIILALGFISAYYY